MQSRLLPRADQDRAGNIDENNVAVTAATPLSATAAAEMPTLPKITIIIGPSLEMISKWALERPNILRKRRPKALGRWRGRAINTPFPPLQTPTAAQTTEQIFPSAAVTFHKHNLWVWAVCRSIAESAKGRSAAAEEMRSLLLRKFEKNSEKENRERERERAFFGDLVDFGGNVICCSDRNE
jgi:hypothetical protein